MRRELERQKQELQKQAAEVRAALRVASDRLRRAPGVRRKQPRREEIAACVARQLGGVVGTEVAQAYLHRGRRDGDVRKDEVRAARDTSLVVAANSHCEVGHTATTGLSAPGREVSVTSRQAEKVCREHLLREWVRGVNEASGLTPNTSQVWERWLAEGRAAPGDGLAPVARSPMCRRAV